MFLTLHWDPGSVGQGRTGSKYSIGHGVPQGRQAQSRSGLTASRAATSLNSWGSRGEAPRSFCYFAYLIV